MAGNLNATGLISLVGLIAISPGLLFAAGPVTLDQVISRESPLLDCSRARLTVGRDGRAYLASTAQGKGFVLRLSLDGRKNRAAKSFTPSTMPPPTRAA